jgi:hypothetical protein
MPMLMKGLFLAVATISGALSVAVAGAAPDMAGPPPDIDVVIAPDFSHTGSSFGDNLLPGMTSGSSSPDTPAGPGVSR